MSDRKTMDVPKYETNELLANVRTHVPDFDMASEIMRRIALTEPSITLRELKALVEGMKKPVHADLSATMYDNTLGYNRALTDLYESAEKGRW